jgi:hypothetical protein
MERQEHGKQQAGKPVREGSIAGRVVLGGRA